MKKIILIVLILPALVFCQNVAYHKQVSSTDKNTPDNTEIIPEPFIQLPAQLAENSGLIYWKNLFWAINDSGGKNEVYGINRQGTITAKVTVANAKNIDWEEIAQDKEFIYVADVGNNNGNRQDQAIYCLPKLAITDTGQVEINAEIIQFSYADQVDFQFATMATAYDCEALIAFDDSLYLFTKDWIFGNTTMYSLPARAGKQVAKPVAGFSANGLITGADLSSDQKTLVLLGYKNFVPFIWVIKNFKPRDFLAGKKKYEDLDSIFRAQTEGICFISPDSIVISCEGGAVFKEQIFLLPSSILRF